MIKVLVVDDSPVVREFLIHILTADPQIEVIGTASNGEEALEAVMRRRPDLITMDIHMPKMNGLEATRRIMETVPTPIVVVSGSANPHEIAPAFGALEVGALAAVHRPKGPGHPAHEATAKDLVELVKLMSEVKVVKRWARPRAGVDGPGVAPLKDPEEGLALPRAEIGLVAMGASTGGPLVIQRILLGLPRNLSVPVVMVQHMAPGFIHGFAEWLGQSSGFPVHVANDGENLSPGHCYLAPDRCHMGVEVGNRIRLSNDEAENGVRPSVSYLFHSVARIYGRHAVGVLLTGMGKDGAEELKLMKLRGAITIAQDEESSVVHGMPGQAILLGASTYVLSPDRITRMLTRLLDKS